MLERTKKQKATPVDCEHANEVPHVCRCPSECYCTRHSCRPPDDYITIKAQRLGTRDAGSTDGLTPDALRAVVTYLQRGPEPCHSLALLLSRTPEGRCRLCDAIACAGTCLPPPPTPAPPAPELMHGSVVKLRSGGPPMTINSKTSDGLLCVWFDGRKDKQRSGVFAPESLVLQKV